MGGIKFHHAANMQSGMWMLREGEFEFPPLIMHLLCWGINNFIVLKYEFQFFPDSSRIFFL